MSLERARIEHALRQIREIDDPARLREIMKNARRQDAGEVETAALRRLAELAPGEAMGPIERELWQTVHTLEEMLTHERGKTTRLAYTRRKIAQKGVHRTLADRAISRDATQRYDELIARGMPELTGEAIVLRHRSFFTPDVVSAAEERLISSGVDLARIIGSPADGAGNG